MQYNNILYKIILGFIISVLFLSCKKEYVNESTPYNEITSFKIPFNNGKDTIVSAIKDDIIYVNWPGHKQWPIPETVIPILKISKNASITPASGAAIPLIDGTSYQVKAENGDIKTYKIKLINTSILPSFVDEPKVTTFIGKQEDLFLNNLAFDGSDTVYLVNDQNTKYKLLTSISTDDGRLSSVIDVENGSGIPIGDYYVEIINKYKIPVRSSKKMFTISDEQKIPYIKLNHTKTWEIKRNEIIDIPIRYLSSDLRLISINLICTLNNETIIINATDIKISNDLKTIQIKIPQNAPIGAEIDKDRGFHFSFTKNNDSYRNDTQYYPYSIKIIE